MKRHARIAILALSAALWVTGALYAQNKPKAVIAEPILDVGVVAKGEKVVKEFILKNEGNAPLEITEVRAACGCTVADFTKSIPAGGSGTVKVTVDTSDFNGPISKGVTAYTNDADNPQIELTVRARYAGYIERQLAEIERARGHEATVLPEQLDYATVAGLSSEVRQKLAETRPTTVGQASRVPGVTPAAISLLLVHLKRGARAA